MFQREMSSLKAMMEKLLEQNSDRVRQVDTAPTTSSMAMQSSNKSSDLDFKKQLVKLRSFKIVGIKSQKLSP